VAEHGRLVFLVQRGIASSTIAPDGEVRSSGNGFFSRGFIMWLLTWLSRKKARKLIWIATFVLAIPACLLLGFHLCRMQDTILRFRLRLHLQERGMEFGQRTLEEIPDYLNPEDRRDLEKILAQSVARSYVPAAEGPLLNTFSKREIDLMIRTSCPFDGASEPSPSKVDAIEKILSRSAPDALNKDLRKELEARFGKWILEVRLLPRDRRTVDQ
jgi:hypothetical protein